MKKLLLIGFALLAACQSATPEPIFTPEATVTRITPTVIPATVTPTVIPSPTSTVTPPPPERYFTEEFDTPLTYWSTLYASGDSSRVEVLNENSMLTFELYSTNAWVYAIYGAFEYERVHIETRVESRGSDVNAIGLVCHYDEQAGWYEFNISSDGMYNVLYGQWLDEGVARYTPIASDVSAYIELGNATNEMGLDCYENILQLYVNGKLFRKLGVAHIGLTEGKVAGLDVIVSRTGYTGERVAYELFVHPQQAPHLWSMLLKVGEPLGLKACGLAARDSTRTEAGLPLYGHELAGDLNLNPGDAGFGGYVKLWKPFFIGRSAFIAHEQERDRMVTRFRMNEKGVRRPETGDPIMDRRGKVVGFVTSCAIDEEGYLLGQAILPLDMTSKDTPIYVYQLGGGQREIRTPKGIAQGARLPMPDGATVLTRFPLRKKVQKAQDKIKG